jgi:SAM-dependent methyltransferase
MFIDFKNIKRTYRYFMKISRFKNDKIKNPHNRGFCIFCDKEVIFEIQGDYLRDNYICTSCKTIPRERAFVTIINKLYPNWRSLKIHESSASGVTYNFFKKNALDYSASQFYPGVIKGSSVGDFRCEDLSNLTFPDECFDLILTQDVFEHIIEPERAFSEISRVLKPGGAHIFTLPWYPELNESRIRARLVDDKIKNFEKPIYHGNPVDDSGSLVTTDWGIDLTKFIFDNSNMFTTIYNIRDRSLGIDAERNEVFVSIKTR